MLASHYAPDCLVVPAADADEAEQLAEVHRASGQRVDVIDLDRWFVANGLDHDQLARPDGIHPTPEAATEISERYLGEQLVRIALGIARP